MLIRYYEPRRMLRLMMTVVDVRRASFIGQSLSTVIFSQVNTWVEFHGEGAARCKISSPTHGCTCPEANTVHDGQLTM